MIGTSGSHILICSIQLSLCCYKFEIRQKRKTAIPSVIWAGINEILSINCNCQHEFKI